MSGLRNFLVGAGQGAAFAAADLAGKYIDDELLRNRQQAFLEMQRTNAVQTRKDIDAFENDPMRRESLRGEASKDAASSNQSRIDGLIAEETNPSLMTARAERLKREAGARSQAEADQIIANGNNPAYTKAIKAIASAQRFTGAGEELARFQLQQHRHVAELRTRLANEQDPAKREDLQRQLADLSGNTKSDRELSVALAQTVTAMERANKVLTDPEADPEAKDNARESIAALRASANHLQRKLGVSAAPAGEDNDPILKAMLANREAKKGHQGQTARPDAASAPKPATPRAMETTRAPDGSTRYRLQGQSKWHGSEAEARRAELDRLRQPVQRSEEQFNGGGFESGF